MKLGGIWIGRPDPAELGDLLAAVRDAPPTYDHVGSTLGRVPGTARLRHHQRDVGSGPAAFEGAVEAIRSWVAQRGLGASIEPPGVPVELGATLLVVLPAGPATMVAPNRVVGIVDEPDRWGFAYGSLPGHPERGEESFVAERRADGTVSVTISVDAEPGTWLTRLGGPVTMAVQRRAIERYLDAIAGAVAGGQPAT